MEISQKQLNQIAKTISISDIKSYIETHPHEYEQFLKEEKSKRK